MQQMEKFLINQLLELKKELKSNKKITLTAGADFATSFNLTPDFIIQSFKEMHPRYEAISDLFGLLSNDGLYWRTKKNSNCSGGEFFFNALFAGVEDFLTEPFYSAVLESGNGFSTEDKICIFDIHPEAGDGIDYLLRFVAGKNELDEIEIWGHDTKETNLYRLDLTFPQYIQAMCHFKCLYNWQWLFVAEEHKERIDPELYADFLKDLEGLKEVFPGLDITKRDFRN